jgi:UDP-N-acetyl-D-mannosaminuronic acid transferase (WecB/TagA/CpsF family)
MSKPGIKLRWPNTTGPAMTEHSTTGVSAGSKRRVRLMSAPMDVVSEARVLHDIVSAAEACDGHWTITANLNHLRRYHRHHAQRSLVDEADPVVADGMPLIWASRPAGEPLPERVAGSSVVWSVCEIASTGGQTIYPLGGDPGISHFMGLVRCARATGYGCAAWPTRNIYARRLGKRSRDHSRGPF